MAYQELFVKSLHVKKYVYKKGIKYFDGGSLWTWKPEHRMEENRWYWIVS
jgi:hypothetical protein